MSPENFDYLLSIVGPHIRKNTTEMRQPIEAAERRYLASGNSQQSMSFAYRLGRTTVSNIIQDTCLAIWDALSETYLKPPSTSEDWKHIAGDLSSIWNMPHCVGAIDGKHIAIECPGNTGSLYYNYKGFYSIVLMAVCDAHYVFSFVNVGDYGSNNDSGILQNSPLGKALENNTLGIPVPEPLDGCNIQQLPYFLVGDEIFGLKTWMQRPYPGRGISESQRVFNYRLSRARRVIENAFGILRARWGVFSHAINASVETAVSITKAALCLHNFLRQTDSAGYCPNGFCDSEDSSGEIKPGQWRKEVPREGSGAMRNMPPLRGRRMSCSAIEVRNALKDYFLSDKGQVPWQLDYVRSRGPTY